MVHNWDASCPELMRADPSEYMDACAHDMWGVGCMLLRVLCNIAPWSVRTGCDQQDRATLCGLHDNWVCTAPAIANHPDALCMACMLDSTPGPGLHHSWQLNSFGKTVYHTTHCSVACMWSHACADAVVLTVCHTLLHDVQAETYNVPDAVHYQGVHAYLDRLYSCLTGPGQYAVVAPLIRHLLNPDVKARATVRQALASQFFS